MFNRSDMIIRTQRLVLRPIREEDLLSMHEFVSDRESTKYMIYYPLYSLSETKEFLSQDIRQWDEEKPHHLNFSVMLEGAHIGSIAMYFEGGETEMELGWILNSRYKGKGYAYEASKALIDYAAGNMGIKRVYACCDSENEPSYRLMERLGMKKVSDNGKRKNRSSDEERTEYVYEIML